MEKMETEEVYFMEQHKDKIFTREKTSNRLKDIPSNQKSSNVVERKRSRSNDGLLTFNVKEKMYKFDLTEIDVSVNSHDTTTTVGLLLV